MEDVTLTRQRGRDSSAQAENTDANWPRITKRANRLRDSSSPSEIGGRDALASGAAKLCSVIDRSVHENAFCGDAFVFGIIANPQDTVEIPRREHINAVILHFCVPQVSGEIDDRDHNEWSRPP